MLAVCLLLQIKGVQDDIEEAVRAQDQWMKRRKDGGNSKEGDKWQYSTKDGSDPSRRKKTGTQAKDFGLQHRQPGGLVRLEEGSRGQKQKYRRASETGSRAVEDHEKEPVREKGQGVPRREERDKESCCTMQSSGRQFCMEELTSRTRTAKPLCWHGLAGMKHLKTRSSSHRNLTEWMREENKKGESMQKEIAEQMHFNIRPTGMVRTGAPTSKVALQHYGQHCTGDDSGLAELILNIVFVRHTMSVKVIASMEQQVLPWLRIKDQALTDESVDELALYWLRVRGDFFFKFVNPMKARAKAGDHAFLPLL